MAENEDASVISSIFSKNSAHSQAASQPVVRTGLLGWSVSPTHIPAEGIDEFQPLLTPPTSVGDNDGHPDSQPSYATPSSHDGEDSKSTVYLILLTLSMLG